MWSFGCILAELLTGYPLFPGEDEADQLACIIELFGMPDQRLLDSSKRARNFISSQGYPRYCSVAMGPDGEIQLSGGRSRRGKYRGPPASKELSAALKDCDDPLFIEFLRRCLDLDPLSRMTPSEAMRHPWLRRKAPKPSEAGDNQRRSNVRSGAVSKYSNTMTGSGKARIIAATDEMAHASVAPTRAKLPQIGSM